MNICRGWTRTVRGATRTFRQLKASFRARAEPRRRCGSGWIGGGRLPRRWRSGRSPVNEKIENGTPQPSDERRGGRADDAGPPAPFAGNRLSGMGHDAAGTSRPIAVHQGGGGRFLSLPNLRRHDRRRPFLIVRLSYQLGTGAAPGGAIGSSRLASHWPPHTMSGIAP